MTGPLTRTALVEAAVDVLDEHARECRPEHRTLAAAIADRLDLPATGERDTLPASPLDLGLWIDDRPALVLSTAYLDRLRALPLSHVAVMVERSGGGLDLTWTEAQLTRLAGELSALERVLTLWPEPSEAYMAKLRLRLPKLLRALDAAAVEFDLEGHWKAAKRAGYSTLGDAGDALMRIVREAEEALERTLAVEVTTFPDHHEARSSGAVIGEDRLLLQTYSVAEARGEARAWDGRYGPERRPYEDVLQARARGAEGEVCAGLAAWEQADWPGEPEEAMRLAIASAQRAGVRRVRWWSARHVIGASANRYAARAIEAARPLSLRAAVG